ncbi:MAG: hypothetical protein HUJ60_00850 [Bacilli bacterium]|nr:hypothetical protein [Bacilli bacterium]
MYNEVQSIKNKLEGEQAESLSPNDIYNLRRILIQGHDGYFFASTFESWTKKGASRQATFKDLTRLEKLGILLSKNEGNKKAYRLNESYLSYIVPKVKEY